MIPGNDVDSLVQEGVLASALDAVRTLEEKFDALAAKVDELDTRLVEVEARVEKIVGAQDRKQR